MIKKVLGWLGSLALIAAITAALLLMVEGGASLWQVYSQAKPAGRLAERMHTQYDPLLGWANLPGVHEPNMYGPGIGLTINAQGFRGKDDTPAQVPAGKVRAICSGDSFTLGYGVNDQNTWPAQLAAQHPRLDTVNMGQGGYGVDQIYLWYKRDAKPLEHQLHIMAFITGDFERMCYDTFLGYPKPWLSQNKGEIIEHNVPVPRLAYMMPTLVRYRHSLSQLSIFQLLQGLVPATLQAGAPQPKYKPLGEHHLEVSRRIFEDLHQDAQEHGRQFVAVFLPTIKEHQPYRWDAFRTKLGRLLQRKGVTVVDLIDPFREKIKPQEVPGLFIAEDIKEFVGAKGHYTAKGNRRFARLLYEELARLEPVAKLLDLDQGAGQAAPSDG